MIPMKWEPTLWLAAQELYQAKWQFADQSMLQEHQVTTARAERTTIFKWRATTPIDPSKSQD